MIADIELTLVSIIQGVALTVLIETSREAVAKLNWIMWPYVLSGLMRTRVRDRTGDVSNRLYAFVKRDQLRNLGLLLPAFFLVNVACAAAIHLRPEFFLGHNGHIWLIALQLIAFGGYLSYVVAFYSKLEPLTTQARAEWRAKSRANETSP